MIDAADLMTAIAGRRRIAAKVVVLVAHPDDETLAMSVPLPLLNGLTLVHASDGSSGGDATARLAELADALDRLGCAPHRRIALEGPDGALIDAAGRLIDRMMPIVAEADIVVTHDFEGGHPDHDACALIGQRACKALPMAQRPLRLCFPLYRLGPGGVLTTRFAAEPVAGALRLRLSAAEADRKRAALSAFASQRHVVGRFPLDVEELAVAKEIDVAQPRPTETVLFARGDPAQERSWRERAAQV